MSRAMSGWGPAVRAAVIGALLVLVMTAPTLTHLTTVGRVDTNDGRFGIWNIAWIAHALTTDPKHILDANIFYPHTGTLAYSELNLVAGVLGLPWYVVTHNPLAALNGAVASALWLAFVLMWALVRRLSESDGAGLVAATAFTFCPYVASKTAEIQLLMIFVFPLVALAFHRCRERPGVGRAVELGGALAISALACGYYGLFAGCALGLLVLVFADRSPRYWGALVVAVVVAAALVFPVYRAFTHAREASGAVLAPHAEAEVRGYSSHLSDYFASSSAAHDWWLPSLARWKPWVEVLFPGLGVLLFAAICLAGYAGADVARRRQTLGYALLAVMAAWASFGPALKLYSILDAVVPGMSLIRAPARFGIVVTFALSVLAGLGVARVSARRRWLPAVLVLLVASELGVRTAEWGWPSWPLRVADPPSVAYRTLATLPRGVFVEFQFPYVSSNYHNHATAMFWSTYHWQPMVNGYSDVIPPDFDAIALPINGFPDPASFAIMKERQVRYVLWHVDYYQGASRDVLLDRLARFTSNLRPIVQTQDTWLYEIVQWPE
ncbi:MAG: hypothetical protein ABI634_19350 [Acidobacteriota bacterium]